jgi:hypothetical protein
MYSNDRRRKDNLDLCIRILSFIKETATLSTDAKNTSMLDRTELIHSSFISLTNDSSMINNADTYFDQNADPAKLTEETEQLLAMALRTLQIQ